MLNAAAIVVFVNKAQPLQPQLDAANAQLQAARQQADAALRAKQTAEDSYNSEMLLHNKDNTTNQAAIADQQEKLHEAELTVARLQADSTNLQTTVNTATSNSQLANATANKLQDQVTSLRTSNDSLVKENQDFSQHNAQLTSTLESLQAKEEETSEQLAQAKDDEQRLKGSLKDRGYDPDAILAQTTPNGLGAPDIEGVVRDKSVINGNTFVTISVGSNDGVAKGMKFNVVDGPDFLGVITIDTVDTDNAIGRLDGPPGKVGLVQKGNEVKTQIRGS
jgi:chromosome segregation ATPase